MQEKTNADSAASEAARALARKRWDNATPEDRARQAERMRAAQAARWAHRSAQPDRDE